MVFWLKKLLGITNKNQVGEVKFERPIESNIFEAYEKGVSLYRKKRHDEALALLDVAADAGLVYAYHWQALCLQYLDFHLDAIDAFSKYIDLIQSFDPFEAESNICNAVFCRSNSYTVVGDDTNAIADIDTAVVLFEREIKRNDCYDKNAKDMGYDNMMQMLEYTKASKVMMSELHFRSSHTDPSDLLRRKRQ